MDFRIAHKLQNPVRDHSRMSSRANTIQVDVIYQKSSGCTTGRMTVQELCEIQMMPTEALYAFMPAETILIQRGMDKDLSIKFHIPPSFWSPVSQQASGYIGSQNDSDVHGVLETLNTFFRFLIKEPMNSETVWSKTVQKINTSYIWHRLGFFTSWRPTNFLIVLCFDLPPSIMSSISTFLLSPQNDLQLLEPFSVHTVLLEHVIKLYDIALWSFRDIIRDLEKHRLPSENPQPDYIGMHEISRHIIHSSEMLETAIATVSSIVQEHEIFINENSWLPYLSLASSKQTSRSFRHQQSLLKSLHLRSKALEKRLRNEINLAFNMVAQNDSRIAVSIGEATKADSAAMKTISTLGLLFLPGTFICAIFSTSFFNFSPGSSTEPQHWTISEKFWIYWAVTIPLTVATSVFWYCWRRVYMVKSPT